MSNELISGMLTVTEEDGAVVAHLETAGAKELTGSGKDMDSAVADLLDSVRYYLGELQ